MFMVGRKFYIVTQETNLSDLLVVNHPPVKEVTVEPHSINLKNPREWSALTYRIIYK